MFHPFTYDNLPESEGLSDEQIKYLKNLDNRPKVIFMHHPAMNENNDERPADYIEEDPVGPNGPGGNDGCIANYRREFVEQCEDLANNVLLVLTGHTHEDRIFDATGDPKRWYDNDRPLFIQTAAAVDGYYRMIEVRDQRAYPKQSTQAPRKPKTGGFLKCSANLHAYNSKEMHTGLNTTGDIELNIPRSFYFGRYNYSDPNEGEMILLFDTNETYRFEIIANFTQEQLIKAKAFGSPVNTTFNFTIEMQTEDSLTVYSFVNVPIFEDTIATVIVDSIGTYKLMRSTPTYTMEIDYDGNGEVDEYKSPDFIETNYAPTATIFSPMNNSIFIYGDEILFNGTGTDPEDGVLNASSLVWTSDTNGIIGFGNEFDTTNLSAGTHTITLMVNDSADLVGTDSIKLQINAPDFTLNSSDIVFSNPNPAEGELITINATVHNIGLVNATNVTVLFFDGIPEFEIGNVTIDAVQAGENETVNVTWNTTGKGGKHSISVMIDPEDSNEEMNETNNRASKSIVVNEKQLQITFFDTGSGTYPSIFGTHNGTITPNQTITISKLYTYPCPGTGGHTEYAAISYSNGTLIAEAHWIGYTGDWHNLSFNKPFTLYENETYNYTIRTGSYPQIIHTPSFNATGGVITCTLFEDVNGRVYYDWIPAIRLFL